MFLRRVHLQITGELPTPREVRRFLASHDQAKRSKEIDSLLGQPEYALHWADLWSGWLLESIQRKEPEHRRRLAVWLSSALADHWPLDRLARELLLARGPIERNGAVGFFAEAPTADEAAAATSRALLGKDVSCAKCHFHPRCDWTAENFLGLRSCFQRVRLRRLDKESPSSLELFIDNDILPSTSGQPVAHLLFGQRVRAAGQHSDPRAAFARWLTAEGKLHFARNVVSRYWGELLGPRAGGISATGGFGLQHPASQPTLLEALTRDFIDNGYDPRRLLRRLCNSRVHQLSSEPNSVNREDLAFYSKFNVARLRGRVLVRALQQATLSDKGDDMMDLIMHTQYPQYVFGKPEPPSRCRRPIREFNLAQALHLINSSALADMLGDPRGRIARLVASGRSDARITEELYLAACSRPPKANERALVQKHLEKQRALGKPRQEGLEDVLWALMNSKEFLFNH